MIPPVFGFQGLFYQQKLIQVRTELQQDMVGGGMGLLCFLFLDAFSYLRW
jgi:hypothetical protein